VVWTGRTNRLAGFSLANFPALAMHSTRTQHRYAAPAGCWILDGFAQVNAWRGGSGDPLLAECWIDAGSTPESVVLRVAEVEVAHPAFADGWV